MREQIMGTHPGAIDAPFQFSLDLSVWNERLARVSWPATTNLSYEIRAATNALSLLSLVTNVTGKFPETEVFLPYTNGVNQFFRVRTLP